MLGVHRRKQEQDGKDWAERKIGGMTPEDAKKLVDSGEMSEWDNPWKQAAFMKLYGVKLAQERSTQLAQDYQTKFPEGGDLNAFLKQGWEQDAALLTDKRAQSGYVAVRDEADSRIRADHARNEAERLTELSHENVGAGILQIFKNPDLTLDEKIEGINALKESSRVTLSVEGKDFNAIIINTLGAVISDPGKETLTQDEYDQIKGILTHDPTGKGGASLATIGVHAGKALELLSLADRKRREGGVREHTMDRVSMMDSIQDGTATDVQIDALRDKGGYTHDEAEAAKIRVRAVQRQAREQLANQAARESDNNIVPSYIQTVVNEMTEGKFVGFQPYSYTTSSGEAKTLSVEEQRKAVGLQLYNTIQQISAGDPIKAYRLSKQYFVNQGIPHPTWGDILQRAVLVQNPETITADRTPAGLDAAIGLYDQLYADSPAYVNDMLGGSNSQSAQYYRYLSVARKYGWTDHQALIAANKALSNPDTPEASKGRRDRVNKIIKGYEGQRVQNPEYARREMNRLIDFWVRMDGINDVDAVKEAEREFNESHTIINNRHVYTADQRIPPDFKELVAVQLQTYADEYNLHHATKYKGTDLQLMDFNGATGGWHVGMVINGAPMPLARLGSGVVPVITLGGLGTLREQKAAEARQQLIKRNRAKNVPMGKDSIGNPRTPGVPYKDPKF